MDKTKHVIVQENNREGDPENFALVKNIEFVHLCYSQLQ
jgi:hypothetical protein